MNKPVALIYILCGNAAYNRGDRGNLLTQLCLLHKAFPNTQIVIDSYRPEVDQRWYDALVLKRGVFLTLEQWRYLKRADVVVWGGGALIADNSCRTIIPYWLVVITLIKVILRKPVMAWAHGLVVETKLGAVLARLTLNQVDMITVRDKDSLLTLQKIGATKPPHYLTADLGLLIKPSSRAVGESLLSEAGVPVVGNRKLVAICPTFWTFYHNKKDIIPFMFARKLGLRKMRRKQEVKQYKSALIRLINTVIERQQADVILMPRYPTDLWDDLYHLEDVCQQSKYKDHVFMYKDDKYPPQDYLAMWRVFDLVISVALHDTLFAIALDRPCVQLFYEPKGKDLVKQLGASKYMCDWSALFTSDGIDRILKLVDYALENKSDGQARRARSRLRRRAGLNVKYLRKLLRENDYLV